MKRKLLMFVLVTLLGGMLPSANAQKTLDVSSFTRDETDLTASMSKPVHDKDEGKLCALIKVETTLDYLDIRADALGIVQKEEHQGISNVKIADAKADTAHHTAMAFLVLDYGDKTSEEIVVPMIEVKGKETGEYSEKDTEVTYVYRKLKGKVIAHYVDIYGNMIGYDIIQEGYVDDKYETKLRKFRGYDFVQIVGDLAGQYRTSAYIYQKREEQRQPIGSPIIIPDKTTILSSKRNVSSSSLSIYDPIEIPNTGIDYNKDYFTFFILMICNISIVLYLRKKVCFD